MSPPRLRVVAVLASSLLVGGCDDKPAPGAGAAARASASAAPTVSAPPAAPAAPATPSKPQLAIDDTGAAVGGDRVEFSSPDPKAALGLALSGKPVAGEELVLDAARNTRMQKVATLFAALSSAKVKTVRVRTARRDGTQAELPVTVGGKLEGCAGVGMIGKDLAIRAWSAGGGVGARFSKGMAGPDNTLGSQGIRKVLDKCEASAWGITADDSVTWGLVVDLALAVLNGEDAGPPKAKDLVLLPTSTVAGRKVEATF